MARQRWIWQNPIDPIDDDEWDDIQDLLTLSENELMIPFGIGSIIPSFVDLDLSDNLLRLDGQTVAQVDYPLLTDVCPAAWLSGSDIILPDMDDTSIHGGYSSPAGQVGANTHQLTIAEMPEHTHVQTAHLHSYLTPVVIPTAGGELPGTADLVTPTPASTGLTTAVNQNTGGDGSHNNIPDSFEVIYYLVAR